MKTCPVCDTDYPDQHTNCPTDGAVLIVSHELAEGSLVRGKYRIIRKLGQGGMGVVYLAEDILLGVQVALKFLAGELGNNPKFITRFRNEARTAYQLRHPNIVEAISLDQAEDGSLFIAMEYVEGESLREAIEEARAGLAIPRALEIARGIASGLALAHSRGTVHRDIKPENILLARTNDGRERAKILDFGIAAITESVTRLSMTHGILLTPEYAAPEQWLEMPAAEMDGRTDSYALGCVLYEMLTGRAPFHAHNTAGWMKQHLEEAPQPPSQLRPDLADWDGLDALVLRLLAKNRDDRPRDAELLSLLDAVHYAPGEQRRETVVEETRKQPETIWETPAHIEEKRPDPVFAEPVARRFPRWAWGVLAALALIGAIVAVRFYLTPAQPESSAQQTPILSTPEPAGQSKLSSQMPAMPQKQELAQTATPRSSNDYPSQTANLIPIKDPSSRNLPPEIAEADRQARELYNQKQYTKSVSLFLKACTGGAVGDCEQLGNIYQYGLGLPYNYSLALPAYSRACDGAVAKGCDDLAYMYRQGYGVTADYAQAMTLYARACDMGEASDCEVVGSWSETGTGDGKVDYAKAAVYFAKGCDKNNSLSCSNLGELYRRGDGVEKNIDKAKTLFNKSCDLGYQQGCLRVKEMQ